MSIHCWDLGPCDYPVFVPSAGACLLCCALADSLSLLCHKIQSCRLCGKAGLLLTCALIAGSCAPLLDGDVQWCILSGAGLQVVTGSDLPHVYQYCVPVVLTIGCVNLSFLLL